MTPTEFKASPLVKYSDWFGSSDNQRDYDDAVKSHGEPLEAFQTGYMLALVYQSKIVIVGYDGNEYTHEFVFERGPQC